MARQPKLVRDALTTNKVRLAILAVVEYTMDLPENNRRPRTVAEGAHTAPVLVELAKRHGVAMPIAEAVGRLLEGAPARTVAGELLARPLTVERSA